MKNLVILLCAIMIVTASLPLDAAGKKAKPNPVRIVKVPKKTAGVLTKVKDAATRGFGFGLGREAAKQVINGAKKIGSSKAVKSGVAKVKAKAKEIIKKQ